MDMKKSFNFSSLTIVLLVIVVLVMSIGYAGFSRTLQINGNASVGVTAWKVEFLDNTYATTNNSTVVVSGQDLVISETSMSYDVTLEKPGDVYEFEIDVKNSGDFDAELDGIVLTDERNEAQKKYLNYVFTYNGVNYETVDEGLGISLASGETATVKVRVEYFQSETLGPDELPNAEQNLNLGVALNYIQSLD